MIEGIRLLRQINTPDDLKQLEQWQLEQLCQEIRDFLINSVSATGGHLASNLGVVELTVALHKVFQLPKDKIVWDVGHQSYTHKLLTGRRKQFSTLRQKNGISGFSKPSESEYDAFIGGHASNSISAAYGIAKANTLRGSSAYTIAVIGDGALTGGLAYEALNNAGRCNDRLIVILNHNEMSISKNVGAFARYLANVRAKEGYVWAKGRIERILDHTPLIGKPVKRFLKTTKSALKNSMYHSTIFEDFGFYYIGPVDGHDLNSLIHVLEQVKSRPMPCLIQIDTKKGKGYQYAEENPGAYHGIPKFDIETGNPDVSLSDSYSDVAGKAIKELADHDPKICAITAAMKYGTGLQHFSAAHRERFFDVGIAEEHAITFAAGLASGGMLPFFAVYSSFLQRGYDQIIHDAAIEGTHIVLAVDRAGIVGDDGETHQGIFDVSFLSTIPGVTIFSPATRQEVRRSLQKAAYECKGVVAVRYPRGTCEHAGKEDSKRLPDFIHQKNGGECLLITYGRLSFHARQAIQKLEEQGVSVSLLKLNRIHPIPEEAVKIVRTYRSVFFFEECIQTGSVAEQLLTKLNELDFAGKYHIAAIPDQFVAQATVAQSLRHLKLDAESMYQTILEQSR